MTELGIGIVRSTWRLKFGLSNEYFSWTPGIIESGKSTPAQYFDSMSDEYWIWGWGYFVVFFAKCEKGYYQ